MTAHPGTNRQNLMRKPWLIFLLLSLAVTALVYRGALTGDAMLAPLDLGPTLFEHLDYAGTSAENIPKNHHIIDQFTYDLPLQAAIHRAYGEGEMPWWDPWTYGGRPLLADAHVNGTDPIRVLCYLTLPFELAYNWNIILRGILTGFGMFLLLRFLGVPGTPAVILGLTHQFAGWFTLFFGHPWIQGSFVYYPFLWVAWMSALDHKAGKRDALAIGLCALIYWSGNLQSHAYLPLFALAFLTGVVWRDRARFLRAATIVISSGLVGALLASPVLLNQIEFLLVGERAPTNLPGFERLLALPFTLFSVHPWPLGTFRTLDVGQPFGVGGTAFLLFCGGAASVIAALGIPKLWRIKTPQTAAIVTALTCILIYLVVISTPLSKILYPRMAGMAGMALLVLTGLACRDWLTGSSLLSVKWARRLIIAFVTSMALSSAFVIAVFPQVKDQILSKVFSMGVKNAGGLGTTELREAQVERLPFEITLLNPEAFLGLLATTIALLTVSRSGSSPKSRSLFYGSLALGLIATVSFHQRFRPLDDIALWENIKKGTDAQLSGVALSAGGLRIDETSIPLEKQIFPHAWATFYQVHAVQGYSALQPASLQLYPRDLPPPPEGWRADWYGDGKGGFVHSEGSSPARFRDPATGQALPIRIVSESHGEIVLINDGSEPIQSFIRTDTRYPGWSEKMQNASSEPEGYAFTKWNTELEPGEKISLTYKPSTASWWPGLLVLGLCTVLVLALKPAKQLEKRSSEPIGSV